MTEYTDMSQNLERDFRRVSVTNLPVETKVMIVENLAGCDVYNMYQADPTWGDVAIDGLRQRAAAGAYAMFPTLTEFDAHYAQLQEDNPAQEKPRFSLFGPQDCVEQYADLTQAFERDEQPFIAFLHDNFGMPLDGVTHAGWTLLGLAARYGSVQIFQYLIRRDPGAELLAKTCTTTPLRPNDDCGLRGLDCGLLNMAAYHGHEEIVDLMLARWESWQEVANSPSSVPSTASNSQSDSQSDSSMADAFAHSYSTASAMPPPNSFHPVNPPNNDETASAASSASTAQSAWLRFREFVRTYTLPTLTRESAYMVLRLFHPPSIQRLHEHICVTDPFLALGNAECANPWAAAILNDHRADAIKFLRDQGETVRLLIDDPPITPLHHAVGKRNEEMIRLALECGCDPNFAPPSGWTAIHALLTEPDINLDHLQLIMNYIQDPNMCHDLRHGTFLGRLLKTMVGLKQRMVREKAEAREAAEKEETERAKKRTGRRVQTGRVEKGGRRSKSPRGMNMVLEVIQAIFDERISVCLGAATVICRRLLAQGMRVHHADELQAQAIQEGFPELERMIKAHETRITENRRKVYYTRDPKNQLQDYQMLPY